MSSNKSGNVTETMLQTMYARAAESKKPNHKFYDAKAIEVVSQMKYDFSLADKDKAMSIGVVARTIVLDGMVSKFEKENPDAAIVNIASGMDTRFYRVDNGRIRWYNVDLPSAMKIRKKYIQEDGRVVNIEASAMDPAWAEQIQPGNGGVLVIVEGLSMYLSESEVKKILSIIAQYFEHVTVFMEIMNPKFVRKNIEKSISQSGAEFTWGAYSGKDVADLCPAFAWKKDISLVEGMKKIYPVFKVIGRISAIKKLSNKIVILQK